MASQGKDGQAAVSVRGLGKVFAAGAVLCWIMKRPPERGGTRALQNVSFDLGAGEALAVLGRNGAGKTTLLEILSALLLPTSGAAAVCGHDVVGEPQAVRRLVGCCPWAGDTFYPRLTCLQNLSFFAALHNLTPAQTRTRIGDLLETLKIEAVASQPVQHCSEGIKQRLALARALLADPPVLLLDEPTKSLDPLFQDEIRGWLREEIIERRGKTVILATHNLEEAERVCDRVAILDRGRLRAIGTPAEVRRQARASDLTGVLRWAVAGAGD